MFKNSYQHYFDVYHQLLMSAKGLPVISAGLFLIDCPIHFFF